MGTEELAVRLGLLEVVRREDDREHRHVGVELGAHQPVEHRRSHEVVAVDAAVDHESGADHRVEAPRGGQVAGQQRDLEGPGDVVDVDLGVSYVAPEAVERLVHDLGVPVGLDERVAPCGHRGLLSFAVKVVSHSLVVSSRNRAPLPLRSGGGC